MTGDSGTFSAEFEVSENPPHDENTLPVKPAHWAFRSWPLLIVAFGCLIALMIGCDIATIDRARRLHDAISEVNETYHRSARRLEQLRSGIHLSSLLIRDYLLDPRVERAISYRRQMAEFHLRVDDQIAALKRSMPAGESQTM